MPQVLMYKDRAIIFDPNEYNGQDWSHDFVTAAIEECHDFLPSDWYIIHTKDEGRVIVVGRKKYEDMLNLQPYWVFRITADPVDERNDWQWLVFDVIRDSAAKTYSFQIP